LYSICNNEHEKIRKIYITTASKPPSLPLSKESNVNTTKTRAIIFTLSATNFVAVCAADVVVSEKVEDDGVMVMVVEREEATSF